MARVSGIQVGLALILWPCSANTFGGEPTLKHVDVFVSGQGGYFAYRIPGIETAPDGSLLAFAEARKHNLHDPGGKGQDIDLVLKRSTDGGQTWSAMKVLEDPGELWSAANPATVVDRDTKRVWLFYLRCRPERNTHSARPGTDDIQVLARTSDDNGVTWSEPSDLTAATRDMADKQWRCSVPGPGGAIQDRRGRLVIPVWRVEPWGVFAAFSEDHGRTWQRGAIVPGVAGDECQLVELADGRLLLDVRQQRGPHRWCVTSGDGGRTWSAPRPGVQVSPVCCAIERFTSKTAGDDRDRLVWTGPKGPGRANLVIRVSEDAGQTFPVERLIYSGPAAYSDLTLTTDKALGVLWERGADQGYQFISYTRLERFWVLPSDAGSSTRDQAMTDSPNQKLLQEVTAAGGWFHARKTRPMWAKPVTADQTVPTLEGAIAVKAGAMLCRGAAGELWPQTPKDVETKYLATDKVDADGWRRYDPRPDAEGVMAARVDHPFVVQAKWGRLAGKAGDYVIKRYCDRDVECPEDVWLVDRQLFGVTYARVEEKKK